MEKVNRFERLIRRLLFRKFETAELLLALSLFLHAMWLIFPNWTPGGSPTEFSRASELIAASVMLAASVIHIPLVLHDWRRHTGLLVRRILSMSSFIGHGYLLMVVVVTADWSSPFVIPYLILTLLGALAYLSMSAAEYE